MNDFSEKMNGAIGNIESALKDQGFDGLWDLTWFSPSWIEIKVFPGDHNPVSFKSVDEFAEWVLSQPTVEEKEAFIGSHHAAMQAQIEAMEW